MCFITVPNQTPNITKIYLTSANSLKVFWVTTSNELINGYRVAYRRLERGAEWSTLAVDKQTSSLHLKKLLKGMVYMVRVLAFSRNGNGIPGEAKEIKMKEGGVLTDSFMDKITHQGQCFMLYEFGSVLVGQKAYPNVT